MENKKAEIIQIILITILVSLSINLISSSIFSLNSIKNIIILLIGIIICLSVVIYYLKIKVKSMNITKIIEGNVILNVNDKNIYKSLEYYSSYNISDNITAVRLENKEINKKYNDSLKNVEKYRIDELKLKNSYFSFILNNAIEYQILDLLTDYMSLNEEDIKFIDLNNAPKEILNNIFVKTLSRDYRKRDVFNDYDDKFFSVNDDEQLHILKSNEGYIYNKFIIAIPKNATLTKKENSLIIKSKFFKIILEWGIDEVFSPFSDMDFYNFFSHDDKIDDDDIEFSYYIKVKVDYTFLKNLMIIIYGLIL